MSIAQDLMDAASRARFTDPTFARSIRDRASSRQRRAFKMGLILATMSRCIPRNNFDPDAVRGFDHGRQLIAQPLVYWQPPRRRLAR